MELQGNYRHELKYRIRQADAIPLKSRLGALMRHDLHAGPDGCYDIHSIYWDNCFDKALREKQDGIPIREKFRIRYYNEDTEHLTLEKKIKHNNLCQKVAEPLSPELCRLLLAPGENSFSDLCQNPPKEAGPLFRELCCKRETQLLRPKVLVSYTREPFVFHPGNVRITFDSDVRTRPFRQELFFSGGSSGNALRSSFAKGTPSASPAGELPEAGFSEMPREKDLFRDLPTSSSPDDLILEVKYDAFLPGVIQTLLQTGTLRQDSFSKYEACRRYE